MHSGVVLLSHFYGFSSAEVIFSDEEMPAFLRNRLEKNNQNLISNVLIIL